MLTTSLISLVCETLDASCAPADSPPSRAVKRDRRERRRERRRDDDAEPVEGPLWSVPVPGAKAIVPFVLDYARLNQSLKLSVNDRMVGTARVTGEARVELDVLIVPYQRTLFTGDAVEEQQAIAFPSDRWEQARSLLSGKPTQFGAAQITLGSIIPAVLWDSETREAVVRWERAPSVAIQKTGPLGFTWEVEAGVKEIRIGEFTGRVRFSKRLVTLLAPDCEWA